MLCQIQKRKYKEEDTSNVQQSKLKTLITENVQELFEAKEIIVSKGDFEVMYPKNSRDVWLIPKNGKPTTSMKKYIKRLSGLGIKVTNVEDADRGSFRVSLQTKLSDPEGVL